MSPDTSSADLLWLQQWYASCCNGAWEHERGVSFTTLDNPGWRVIIDLVGTPLDRLLAETGEPPGEANGNVGGKRWMVCKIAAGQFIGAGDPEKLSLILGQFRAWVQLVSRAQ